eukprot:429735_1
MYGMDTFSVTRMARKSQYQLSIQSHYYTPNKHTMHISSKTCFGVNHTTHHMITLNDRKIWTHSNISGLNDSKYTKMHPIFTIQSQSIFHTKIMTQNHLNQIFSLNK